MSAKNFRFLLPALALVCLAAFAFADDSRAAQPAHDGMTSVDLAGADSFGGMPGTLVARNDNGRHEGWHKGKPKPKGHYKDGRGPRPGGPGYHKGPGPRPGPHPGVHKGPGPRPGGPGYHRPGPRPEPRPGYHRPGPRPEPRPGMHSGPRPRPDGPRPGPRPGGPRPDHRP